MNVYFTEALSRAFKERALAKTRDATPDSTLATRYSDYPPSEEARSLYRAIFPVYRSGNFPSGVASGIARVLAETQGIPIRELHPLLYALGSNSTLDDRTLLNLSDLAGVVMIADEFLPYSLFNEPEPDFSGDSPNREPHNRLLHWPVGPGRISVGMLEGLMFAPTFLNRDFSNISPTSHVEVPPAEITRSTTDPYRVIECFRSAYRYTGGVRLATASEINAMFETHFLPGSWYGFPSGYPVADFFHLIGLHTVWNSAQMNAPAEPSVNPTIPAMAPTTANSTNVVGRSRPVSPNSRRDREGREIRPGRMSSSSSRFFTSAPAVTLSSVGVVTPSRNQRPAGRLISEEDEEDCAPSTTTG